MIFALLSDPKSMLFWMMKESENAIQEAQFEEIIGKLREAEIVLAQGASTAEACRQIAVSEQTYYRWHKEFGGLKTDQARRMKDLEKEMGGLRRAISDLTLDKLSLRRLHGETSEPRAPTAVYRPCPATAVGVRAVNMPRARAASIDAAKSAVRG